MKPKLERPIAMARKVVLVTRLAMPTFRKIFCSGLPTTDGIQVEHTAAVTRKDSSLFAVG